MAASGGYYLATACDRIFASSTSITGSIGIFGLFFDVQALLNNKLGVTIDTVKTNRSADLFTNLGRGLNEHEKIVIQKFINKGYDTFLERVSTGRNMSKKVVGKLACGRVWPGRLAQEQGLVDEIGGLDKAIQAAAELAALEEDVPVSYWPQVPTLSEKIFHSLREGATDSVIHNTLLVNFPALGRLQELSHMIGIQARWPCSIEIE